MSTFAELGINPHLARTLAVLSIRSPTSIQQHCLLPIIKGRDCLGVAKTGSGKTLAFALPIIQSLANDPYGIYALVLTPTRELAFQLSTQFAAVGSAINVQISVVIGGMDMIEQSLEMERRPHIVIATPGRLVDVMRNGEEIGFFDRIRYLVLDEADRLLSSSFTDDLKYILSRVNQDRQTLLFTATLTPQLEAYAQRPPKEGKEPTFVHIEPGEIATPENLRQHYIFIPSHVREVYLYYLLLNFCALTGAPVPTSKPSKPSKPSKHSKSSNREQEDQNTTPSLPQILIFVTHPRTASYLSSLLSFAPIPLRSVPLHSHLTQKERLANLEKFRTRQVPLLICTDVASRGLDLEGVEGVINWELPMTKARVLGKRMRRRDRKEGEQEEEEEEPSQEAEDEYIHRVGRTARIVPGKGRMGGVAVTFVGKEDVDLLLKVEQRINTKLTPLELPESKVLDNLNKITRAKREANTELFESNFGRREEARRKKKRFEEKEERKRRKKELKIKVKEKKAES
ncbi:DEAD-domain-containing protein [Atractiella rhizophila]|nr:DEAD-domain-containing protein [Atractiella rhizophila]